MITEPFVALTDYFLALESAIFAFFILKCKARGKLKWSIFFFYATLVLSSFVGGTVHGFFLDKASLGNIILWRLTLILLGLLAFFSWVIAAEILFHKYSRIIFYAASIEFMIYSYYVMFISQDFKISVYNYAPPTFLLLISFAALYLKKKNMHYLSGVLGILMTFAAAWIQRAKINISPVYLNHNFLYHIVQAVALVLIFISFRQLLALERKNRD